MTSAGLCHENKGMSLPVDRSVVKRNITVYNSL